MWMCLHSSLYRRNKATKLIPKKLLCTKSSIAKRFSDFLGVNRKGLWKQAIVFVSVFLFRFKVRNCTHPNWLTAVEVNIHLKHKPSCVLLSCRNNKKEDSNQRDNTYNEAVQDEHVMITEPDYSTGLIQKTVTECPRQIHCTAEPPSPIPPGMTLKRGGTTTIPHGHEGFPPPPSFLLTTTKPHHGHQYESPTFTWAWIVQM